MSPDNFGAVWPSRFVGTSLEIEVNRPAVDPDFTHQMLPRGYMVPELSVFSGMRPLGNRPGTPPPA